MGFTPTNPPLCDSPVCVRFKDGSVAWGLGYPSSLRGSRPFGAHISRPVFFELVTLGLAGPSLRHISPARAVRLGLLDSTFLLSISGDLRTRGVSAWTTGVRNVLPRVRVLGNLPGVASRFTRPR